MKQVGLLAAASTGIVVWLIIGVVVVSLSICMCCLWFKCITPIKKVEQEFYMEDMYVKV